MLLCTRHLRQPAPARPPSSLAPSAATSAAASTPVHTQRHECKDFIAVYRCADWSKVAEFQAETADLQARALAPRRQRIIQRV